MALAKIKSQYASTVVAFGNSGLPLGERDDIDQLALMAQESKNPNLIKYFEVLPSAAELKKQDTDNALKKSVAAVRSKKTKPQPVSEEPAEEKTDPINPE